MVAFNKSMGYTFIKGDIMKKFIEKFKEKQRESKDKREEAKNEIKKLWKEYKEDGENLKKCFTKEGWEEAKKEVEEEEAIAKERYERYLLGDETLVLTKWEFFKFKIWPILTKVLKVLVFVVIFGAILLGYTIYYALIAIVVLYIVLTILLKLISK